MEVDIHPLFKESKYRYFGMRHAESISNVKQCIASTEKTQLASPLTENGKKQIEPAVSLAIKNKLISSDICLISSPFIRTYETSQITAACLGINPKMIRIAKELQERDFGQLDGNPVSTYHHIWDMDTKDITHTYKGVESIHSIYSRLTQLITTLENEDHPPQQPFLLVSHGDPLHILCAAFKHVPLQDFRQLPYFDNAEIRAF